MSEGLSRVKSRKKQYKGEDNPPVKGKSGKPVPAAVTGQQETPAGEPGTLSRKARQTLQRTSGKPKGKAAAKEGEETPSRAQSYPSERIRFSKMFINSLIIIFVLLLAFLLWWGIIGAPPLKTLW
ncbi:hypothetical protein [Paenibacillus sp. MMS20-IR301]|uniref:hypothetical protein n=1 Tax=Paenibacillus sp. MMS20-IR301 TaxID=2895946 RepID=UPI0028E486D3|nr:hypothetical protein [Paenibacillus sp. MMS20-IR301]WNS44466.1 hypothetical protein LOS79_04115 [Paenibacillus sp. MMS20-IR301]